MKTITLTQGKFALVDDDDFAHLNLFKWYAKESKSGFYAVRKERINRHSMRGCKVKKKDERKTIRMHNAVMKPSQGYDVHHIDSDGLNNQRNNLELVTPSENNTYAAEKRKENKQIDSNEVPF